MPINIKKPSLWWSAGLGEQYIYNFTATVEDGGCTLASKIDKTGLRSIRLVREKDEGGVSFYFELNGVPVFMKGANYIPCDIFLPRFRKSPHRQRCLQRHEKVKLDAESVKFHLPR